MGKRHKSAKKFSCSLNCILPLTGNSTKNHINEERTQNGAQTFLCALGSLDRELYESIYNLAETDTLTC